MRGESGALQGNLTRFGVALPSLGGLATHNACGAFVVPGSLKLLLGSLAGAEIQMNSFASKAERSFVASGFWVGAQSAKDNKELEVSKLKCGDFSLYGSPLCRPPDICDPGLQAVHCHAGFPVKAEGCSGSEWVTAGRVECLMFMRTDSELTPIGCR